VAVPEPWAERTEVRDAWGGGTVPVAGGSIELAVPPRDARILVAADGGEEH
jgi:hypothetical protein